MKQLLTRVYLLTHKKLKLGLTASFNTFWEHLALGSFKYNVEGTNFIKVEYEGHIINVVFVVASSVYETLQWIIVLGLPNVIFESNE